MAHIKKTLSHGVNLTLIPDERLKTNLVTVSFLCDLSEGAASLNTLLANVLSRGTKSYPTLASINARKDELYGADINVWTGEVGEIQRVCFSAGYIASAYIPDKTDVEGGALDLLRELITSPVVKNGALMPDWVEGEKTNAIEDIKSIINDKRRYLIDALNKLRYKGERAAVRGGGEIDIIKAITPAGLYEHYKRVISTYPVEIYAVGKFDEEALIGKLTAIFANIKITPTAVTPTAPHKTAARYDVVEELPVNQGKLAMAFTSDSADEAALNLIRMIYGGSPNSKLFMNVREKLHLCYYCAAGFNAPKATLTVDSGIEVANRDIAQNEILTQLADIANGTFTDEDIAAGKRTFESSYKKLYDRYGSVESFFLEQSLRGSAETPESLSAAVNAVTRERITAAAKTIKLEGTYFLKGMGLPEGENGGNQ